jgi:predicted ATPase
VGSDGTPVHIGPESISDGTIRSAAVLAALFQPRVLSGMIPLVCVEEPEAALHPAAAGVLYDALTEASELVQVIATSQSADLLDREGVDPRMVRVVTSDAGLTQIGEVDQVSRAVVEEKRFTLGELMRANQLEPAPREAA